MDNVVNLKLPLMATIKETVLILKERAQQMGIKNYLTEYRIREMAKNGEIVSISAGKKILINVDKLIAYMNTAIYKEPTNNLVNGIKKIKV